MGYYTEFVLSYKQHKIVTCDRDGFEEFADNNINKLVESYALCKQYIKNLLLFLNIDRSDNTSQWPKWYIEPVHHEFCCDNMYFIYIDETAIGVYHGNDECIFDVSSVDVTKLKKSHSFEDFLNRRFLLNKIWKIYDVPRDLAVWIQCTYF